MSKYKKLYESENVYYTNVSYDLIPDYLKMINDREVQIFLYKTFRTYTSEQETEWVKEGLEKEKQVFSIIEKDTDSFVGNIEYLEFEDGYELGICITPEMQNKHYGTEAIKFMIDYGRSKMGLDDIKLSVYSHNVRAIHCYKKLGFVEYNVTKDVYELDGQSIDEISMVLKK